MLDKLFEKWLDDVFVMLMSKSKKEVARLAFRAGYHACESAQHSVQATGLESVCPECGAKLNYCTECEKRVTPRA